jgi:DNA replication and repair protein RecF
MRILHLSLTNFRNFSRLELDLPPGTALFEGDNAQGKTNLLEAIYYLSRARSPRTSVDRELVNWLALEEELPFARLLARIEKRDEASQIELSLAQGWSANAQAWRKQVRVNGVAKRALDAVGVLSVVLFLPQDIELVAGSPHLRRRYLDDAIGQIDPRYRRELGRYEKVLTQRNCLLRSLRGRGNDSEQLAFWDQRLSEHGAYITVRRQQALVQLDQIIQRIHPRLTGEMERLRLRYCASVQWQQSPGDTYQALLPLGQSAAGEPQLIALVQKVAGAFAVQLREVRSRDMEQGASTVGPHRDDVLFLVDGVDMNTFGSRGQQRTVALSIKLAELEWVTQAKDDPPVLLLDDVLSELDAMRRSLVMQAIAPVQQVLVTTNDVLRCDPQFVAQSSLWRVNAGRLERINPSEEGVSWAPPADEGT